MQKVSKAYKESMKSSLRERAYIMISFGLVNQEAQAKATVDNGSYAYYSNKDNIFGEHIDDTVYATLEEEFTKVDGSMFFLPRATEGGRYYDTGIVSDKLVSEARCEVIISLNTIATDFKGLTINFGENYPVDFDIVGSTGQTIEFRGNTKSKWSTEEVLENTTYIKLVFYKMKNPQSRLRIYSIMFGYGLVYYNDSVMSSALDSYVSPIGADVPQFDFSVTLKNYDHYFNVDNPNSAINYLETGQEMDIMYGYQTPGSDTIEWIQGNHLWCSEWESDDNTATIRCQDIFRNMDGEYVKGLYSAAGKSYYALAEEILKDAGISEYYIDPRLKKLYSNNPIPRVKYKEALQIIANACRCVLTQSRDGKVQIKSNFMPSASIATNGEETYSNAANVLTDTPKVEYATLAGNYTPTDGTMFFLPRNGKAALTTGYVSKEISGANGTFTKNPVVTLARYDFENYDVLIIDEDGDEYEFKYVPLVDGCEMQIGFDENGVPGVVVVGADGTENYVSGTLNGSSGATGGGETVVVQEQQQTVTGTGYDTNGQFVFEVYNNSAYDIYALYIGVINASSDHDIDVLPQILPANSSTTIVGQATMGDWSQTEWTLYVEDVDGDTSASFDSFNPWTVSYVDIYWQGDSYVCDFTY